MTGHTDDHFLGEEKEWLVQYCRSVLKNTFIDYFIFGHRHLPIDHALNETSRYINLGDWIRYNSYAVFDGQHLELKTHPA
jgi:UDP-2,3-diacylglucosamine hydrolase